MKSGVPTCTLRQMGCPCVWLPRFPKGAPCPRHVCTRLHGHIGRHRCACGRELGKREVAR